MLQSWSSATPPWCQEQAPRNKPVPYVHSLSVSPAPQTCCTARATTCQWHCDSPLWVTDSPSANLGFVSSISEEQQPRNVFQQKSWPRTCTVFLMILQNSNFPLYLPNTMEIAVHKCVWKLKPSD